MGPYGHLQAQFCLCRRRNSEEIYSYVEALQRLADMVCPLWITTPRSEDMVVDQFLQGRDRHESECPSGCLGTMLRAA